MIFIRKLKELHCFTFLPGFVYIFAAKQKSILIFLNKLQYVADTVFPHIVPAATIVFLIWKSKGHST